MDVIEEGSSNKGHMDEDKEVEDILSIDQSVGVIKPKSIIKGSRPAPLEVLNHIQMNDNTMETPVSTITGCLNIMPNQTELKFNKENLNKIEQQLKRAFVEFYQKLRLLKGYR